MPDPSRTDRLRRTARRMVETYDRIGGINRIGDKNLPARDAIVGALERLLGVTFPGYYGGIVPADVDLEVRVASQLGSLCSDLQAIIESTLRFCAHSACGCSEIWPQDGERDGFAAVAEHLTLAYLEGLPEIREQLKLDVQAAYDGDPAALNTDEVILCYPGTLAIAVHRLAHPLYAVGVPLVPRIMCEWAHHRSGVDIHPGAHIGASFFIDHGTGVVIGETTDIGARVKIYQGVTLGALSFQRNPDGTLAKGGKRHPTLEDDVTIYANATILGGETVIGQGAVIGGGTWIIESVPAGAKVVVPSSSNSK